MDSNKKFKELIRYGKIISDKCFFETSKDSCHDVRVRIFDLSGETFYVRQEDGEVKKIEKLS